MKRDTRTPFSLTLLSRAALLALLVLCLPVIADTALSEAQIKVVDLPNYQRPENSVLVSGQPSAEQLKMLQEIGVQHIVTLRPASELNWDEQAVVTGLGMQFHRIPVNGAAGVTTENAAELNALLETLNGQPVLLHCASGNRVGALTALHYGQQQGYTADQALAEGKRWGLTRLESLVRQKLNDQTQVCCADDMATPNGSR